MHWLNDNAKDPTTSYNEDPFVETPSVGKMSSAESREAVRSIYNNPGFHHPPNVCTSFPQRKRHAGGTNFTLGKSSASSAQSPPISKNLKLFIMEESATHVPKSEADRGDLRAKGHYFAAFPYLAKNSNGATITQADFEALIRASDVGSEFSRALWSYAFYHQHGFKLKYPMYRISDTSDNFPSSTRWADLVIDSNKKPIWYDLIVKPYTIAEEDNAVQQEEGLLLFFPLTIEYHKKKQMFSYINRSKGQSS